MAEGQKRPEWAKRWNRIIFPFLWFLGLWILWAVWKCRLGSGLQPSLTADLMDSLGVKTFVWLVLPLPTVLSSHCDLFLPLRRLFSEPFPWLAAIVLLCLSAAFLHTVRLINGLQNTYIFFDPYFILFSLSAGVIEEMSFRGLLFNVQEPMLGLWPAAMFNGLLFVLFHYPDLLFGGSWLQLVSLRALLIFSMGVLFCWMFHRWKNLALNMTVHTVWNILSYLFCLV